MFLLLLACGKGSPGFETGTIDDSEFHDEDGDGYGAAEDCDDGDEAVNPGADELCNDLDDDCDDSDGDVNPGASESCNGTDDDCDGDVDEGLLGSGSDCAATDCAEVLADHPSATDGTYTLDDGSGSYEVECEMDIDGGAWTQMTSSHLATLSTSDSREYLYSSGSAWYISPSTTLVWSWSSYQVLEGSYSYASSGTTASGSFSCTDVEAGHWASAAATDLGTSGRSCLGVGPRTRRTGRPRSARTNLTSSARGPASRGLRSG
ncbi:MAG TPA: MopE-related protein [Myxococcota bacterium]|nr:MopE-related protein [Myxococcota bacterium]